MKTAVFGEIEILVIPRGIARIGVSGSYASELSVSYVANAELTSRHN